MAINEPPPKGAKPQVWMCPDWYSGVPAGTQVHYIHASIDPKFSFYGYGPALRLPDQPDPDWWKRGC